MTRTNLTSGKTVKFVDEVREERFARWSGKRILVRALLLYLSVATVVSFSLFVQFETVKQGGFSCMGLQNLKAWNEYDACNQAQLVRVNGIEKTTNLIDWVAPWIGWAYSTYLVMEHDRLSWAFKTSELGRQANAAKANSTVWTYQYQVSQFKESDLAGLKANIASMQSDGWHIKDLSHAKIGSDWFTVIVWEKVTQ